MTENEENNVKNLELERAARLPHFSQMIKDGQELARAFLNQMVSMGFNEFIIQSGVGSRSFTLQITENREKIVK